MTAFVPSRASRLHHTVLALTLALGAAVLAACRPSESPPPPATATAVALREQVLLSGPWRVRLANEAIDGEAPDLDDAGWKEVRVPHTWGKDRYRNAWYRTRFHLGPADAGRRVFISFEGVATVAEVHLNGRRLGSHNGAYTGFLFDATPHLTSGENLLAVRVTNHPRDTADSLPSGLGKTLYHAYGGVYRKVWLLKTGPDHIDPTDHAAAGVYVTPWSVTAEGADVSLRTLVRNGGGRAKRYEVRHHVLDPQGAEVLRADASVDVPAGERGEARAEGRVDRPRLWGPGHPHLYTVRAELWSEGRKLDEVRVRTGFRDFRLQDGAFVLNGAPLLLRGVGKHQESEDALSAVSDEELSRDFEQLRDLGVNIVRLAHYPHAPLEYDLADEAGILVWAENGHSNTYKAGEAGDVITREMVRQLYNHPSIVMWSVGNETGYVRVNRYAAVARGEDPSRLITYASNTGAKGKKRYPDLDFIGHNTYRGWYRGSPWDFESAVLAMRYIAESGAGAVVTSHVDYARTRHVVDVFEPEEYRQRLAEVHYQVVFRDHPAAVPLYLVWILRDFGIDKYKGVWNTKGLLTYSSFKKDAYYLYQSFLRPEHAVVHLASKTWFLRSGDARGVKAYSNRAALRLFVNGDDQGLRRNGDHRHSNGRRVDNVFFWPAALRPGRNDLRVTDESGHEDTAVVYGPGPSTAEEDPISELTSSNPRNPAVFIAQGVREQWPFYAEFDGTADNTFDRIPEAMRGASWIATRRLSRKESRTDLAFVARRPLLVMIAAVGDAGSRAHLERAGFRDAGAEGRWRTNDLRLEAFRVFSRTAAAGERVVLPGLVADYVVTVKEAAVEPRGRAGDTGRP